MFCLDRVKVTYLSWSSSFSDMIYRFLIWNIYAWLFQSGLFGSNTQEKGKIHPVHFSSSPMKQTPSNGRSHRQKTDLPSNQSYTRSFNSVETGDAPWGGRRIKLWIYDSRICWNYECSSCFTHKKEKETDVEGPWAEQKPRLFLLCCFISELIATPAHSFGWATFVHRKPESLLFVLSKPAGKCSLSPLTCFLQLLHWVNGGCCV